jgi:hypothetical protein
MLLEIKLERTKVFPSTFGADDRRVLGQVQPFLAASGCLSSMCRLQPSATQIQHLHEHCECHCEVHVSL